MEKENKKPISNYRKLLGLVFGVLGITLSIINLILALNSTNLTDGVIVYFMVVEGTGVATTFLLVANTVLSTKPPIPQSSPPPCVTPLCYLSLTPSPRPTTTIRI